MTALIDSAIRTSLWQIITPTKPELKALVLRG